MQIIDIGICINNTDPKGIGRIRYRPYSLFVSEITMGIPYEEWDEQDPFIAIPFLPLHINIVPQIQQSIKIIRYDTDKDTQNIEYLAGPYTSPHDLQNQTFTSQHKNTTYGGVIVKDIKDIRNKNGKFNSPVTEGTMVKSNDIGFRGNYGSDVIFTENGIQIRGGMLYAKQGKNKQSLLQYPQLSKKMGRFSLKKFPTTMQYSKETATSESIAVSRIKYIIEYEIDNLTTPTQLSLFAYKIIGGYGSLFNTNVFNEFSVFSTTDTESVKLINTGNTLTDATYIKPLNGTISSAYIELREILHLINIDGLKSLNKSYSDDSQHPFYYRPTTNFTLTKGTTSTEITNKTTFLSKVQVLNKVEPAALIYSRQSANPPIIFTSKIVDSVKEIKTAGEQSFSNLSADKIYLVSTSANTGSNVKKINFNELNEYELSQEDYVTKIEPNTYATVRGENLYNLLMAMKNLLDSHVHNINEPLVKGDPNWVKLNELIETLRNDLLNDSIRIN